MTNVPPREYSYREFCDYVRRFNQDELLTAVARTALALPDNASMPGYARTPPWALAAVAKASICHGNPYRSTPVRANDIGMACHMHNNLAANELQRPELNSPFGILTRIAYEQFPYQESFFEEMARPLLFFNDYSGRKQLEIINNATLAELIGAPLLTALGVTMLLHTSANVNSGFFDPNWMDQANFIDVLAVLPRDEVLAVINSVFANDFDESQQQDAEAQPLPFLSRYQFNPLSARPLVRLRDGRLLAPVPQLIPRKLSPLELYYLGVKRWKQPFTRDMGELLEDYLGRQFRTLPDAQVHSEITYKQGKDVIKSVEWIIVFEDLLVLVEAKAGRATAAARAAGETAPELYKRTLGKAFGQISRTYRAIQSGVPEFAHIPRDRPVIGVVGTLDSWYMANSFARSFLPVPDVPTVVASVRGIEHLVAIGQRRCASEALAEIMRDGDERQTWELGVALRDFIQDGDRNPLLMQAWQRLPFGDRIERPSPG